jgi:hypothetical protein
VTRPAVRRALQLGDVWHPTTGVDLAFLRETVAAHPELRFVPRTTPERVDEFLELGAEGAVVMFSDVASMRELVARYR